MRRNEMHEVTVLSDRPNKYLYSPSCFADSYKEAFEIARPWIEQGYQVVFHLVSEGEILNE